MAAPAEYRHGITVSETTTARRTISTIATAVIGLIATGPAADAAAFPLDRPVLVEDLPAAIAKAGATGTLKHALEAILAQVRAPVVVVRVADAADADATSLNVIGTDVAGRRTGMQALLAAEALVGVKPRILGAPGLDDADVAEALGELGDRLRAIAYARAEGDDVEEVIAYRAAFTSRALMLIHPDFTVRTAGEIVTSYAVAHAMGLRAAIDKTQGFNKTLSNVPVADVVGITRDIAFDLQDPECDANRLNAHDVTTLVRLNGQLRFWGSRTCSADANFAFESATRTAHIIADTMANGLAWAIDKPLVPSLARDIVEEINAAFRQMKSGGQILGAEAWYDPSRNPTESLKLGKLAISYRYTPTPPLEHLGLVQEITDEFLADFSSLVTAG
jgi:phage tail sheath protein FI